MSVLKAQRKESPFEVLDFYCKLRKEFLELTYRNFGYKGSEAFMNKSEKTHHFNGGMKA